MQIQLKETEIVSALKDYISKKGIDLVGKSVNITFTASRKEAGLSAELTIDDLGIPKYSEEADHAHASAAVVSLVKAATAEVVVESAAETKTETPEAMPVDEPVEIDVAEASPAATKPVSLFS